MNTKEKRVQLGDSVNVTIERYPDISRTKNYEIISKDATTLTELSINSPIGQAVYQHQEGDISTVPFGSIELTVTVNHIEKRKSLVKNTNN